MRSFVYHSLTAPIEQSSSLFPYTTLFRSPSDPNFLHVRYGLCAQPLSLELVPPDSTPIDQVDPAAASALHRLLVVHRLQPRSEEHTSELQSRRDLVCRLLLERKNHNSE